RQVTDAAPRVKDARTKKRLGGTGIEAGGTGAAVAALVYRVRAEFQIEQQGPQKEIAAQSLVEQHGVLAEPPQAGAAGKIALQERGGIHDSATPAAGDECLHPGEQLVQTTAQDIMIVFTPGIAGHLELPIGDCRLPIESNGQF